MKKWVEQSKKFVLKNFFAIKIIASIVCGFLPSFLFIASFISYGSPFSNYIKFLLDFNSSSGAWVSAMFIFFFTYFLFGFIKSGERFKKIIANKRLLIILIILFAVIFILIAVQLYLYVNFTLRNDILVQLSADKENIFFTDDLPTRITFTIDLIMNPFCVAQCEYEFFDISRGKEIDNGSFNTTILSKSRVYAINNNNLIDGSQELKRFEVSCKSKKTLLCYTREEESKRAILVTINYALSEEEKTFKDSSRGEIIKLNEIFYISQGKLNESIANINSVKNSFYIGDFLEQISSLQNTNVNFNTYLEKLKGLWENQDFNSLREELSKKNTTIINFENLSRELNANIVSNISLYNTLTENFSNSRQILEKISQNKLTDLICKKLNNIIVDYNNAITDFKNTPVLEDKKIIAEKISSNINDFYKEYQNGNGGKICLLTGNINQGNLEKISIASVGLLPVIFSLDEPAPSCCLSGECGKCCDEKCSNENYPIIFLHGQSINEAMSVGYSLDTFSKIKEALTSERYIDAGAIILGTASERGLWGKMNLSFIMTGSYFFDTYKTETGEKTVSSNQEGIDTYAIRLKNIIETVKYRTNKNKVILVAHSMGGVVARRYIQIFGGSNVEKAIFVTSPHHGIDDKIRDYCAVIGPEVSCRELDENSIFMNQLNNMGTEKIPIYNFVGTGCDMGDETGDGVIKNSSQYLETAKNYYFKGTCDEINFAFFHEYIIHPDKYPEVYNTLYEILKNFSSSL